MPKVGIAYPEPDLFRRKDILPDVPLSIFSEYGTQVLVARNEHIECIRQRGKVQFAIEFIDALYIVGHIRRFRLTNDPKPPLSCGQRIAGCPCDRRDLQGYSGV